MATVADAWRPTSELEHRLQETVRAGDQESYFRLLADSELVVPVPPELVDGVLANETQPSWPTQEEDGRVHVLAYTSASAMRACLGPSYQHFMTVRFGDIAETWPDARWWLAIDAPAHGVGTVLPIEARMPAWFVRQVAEGDGRPPQVGRAPAAWEELRHQHRDLPRQSPRPEFQPANDVERELLRAASNNDHDLFLQTLADTDVLLPVPDEMDFALRPGRPGFPWQTREVDGSTVVPVFTSPERLLEASGAGTEYITLPFTVALRYWPNHDWLLAINSGSPAGGTVLAQQLPGLATWADQRAAQRMTDHFEPQNDVEQRLFDVARRRDTDAFYKTLLGAQVLVPADADTPWGIVPGDPDFPWRPVPVHGRTSIQVFTSLKWMNDAIGSSRFIMPSLHEMVAAWPDADWTLVLNPGTPIDASMPADQLRTLRGPATPPSASTPPPPENPAVPVEPAVPPESTSGRHSAPAAEGAGRHSGAPGESTGPGAPTVPASEGAGQALPRHPGEAPEYTASRESAAGIGGGGSPEVSSAAPGPETGRHSHSGMAGGPTGGEAPRGEPGTGREPLGSTAEGPHGTPQSSGGLGDPAPQSSGGLGDLAPLPRRHAAPPPGQTPGATGTPGAPPGTAGPDGSGQELPGRPGETPHPYPSNVPQTAQDATGTEPATSPREGVAGMGGGRDLAGTGATDTAPGSEAGPAHGGTGAPEMPHPGETLHDIPDLAGERGAGPSDGPGRHAGLPHERLLGDGTGTSGMPGHAAEGALGATGRPPEGAPTVPGPAGPAGAGSTGLPGTSDLTGAPGTPAGGDVEPAGLWGESPQQGFGGDASGLTGGRVAGHGTPGVPHEGAPNAPGPIGGTGPAGAGDTGTPDLTGAPSVQREGVPNVPDESGYTAVPDGGGYTAVPGEGGYTDRPGTSEPAGAPGGPPEGGGNAGPMETGDTDRPGMPGAPNVPDSDGGAVGAADGSGTDWAGRPGGVSQEGFAGGLAGGRDGGAGASHLPGIGAGTEGEFAARPDEASPAGPSASDAPGGLHAGAPGDAAPGLRAVEDPEPEFEPGNRIDQELHEAASVGDSDAFLRVLLNANVLVPIPAEAPLEMTPMQREFRWDAALRSESAVQVFTSLVRLREVLPDSRFVYADFRRLIGAWPRDDWAMLLNPGTRIGASLQGDQVRALSEWAMRVGLVPAGPEVPLPPPRPEPEPEQAQLPSDPDDRVSSPTIMQKVVPHGHVAWYLEQGYDRVGGFVHSTADVAELQTPAQLYEALGMLYDGSPFSPADDGVYVIRWPAYCPDLYRVPFGGRDEAEMSSWGDAGWVIERPPFLGSGFAPGSAGSIREYKVDSVRLPYGAEMYYLGHDRSERFVAMYDPDRLAWLRPEAGTEGRDGRTEAAQ